MGARTYPIPNGLYGHKGEIEEKIAEGKPVRWLTPSKPSYYGDVTINARNFDSTDRFIEKLKKHRDEVILGDGDDLRLDLKIELDKAPEDLKKRIMDWKEDNQEKYRLLEGDWFEGYIVEVRIGKRGGVEVEGLLMVIRN